VKVDKTDQVQSETLPDEVMLGVLPLDFEDDLDDFLDGIEDLRSESEPILGLDNSPFTEVGALDCTHILHENRVRELVDYYKDLTCDFSEGIFYGIHLDIARFKNNMKLCLDIIEQSNPRDVDPDSNHGYIEARQVAAGARIFVRSDLHGDLNSLLQNLKKLCEEEFLDENYRCSEGFHLIFTGDHIDRGRYSLQVLELLAFLKAENPHQVHLLRGNHENIDINLSYGNMVFHDFIESEVSKNRIFPIVYKNKTSPSKTLYIPRSLRYKLDHNLDYTFNDGHVQLLNRFYRTMPLTLYMGQENEGVVEYVDFTHALMDIDIDPTSILDSDKPLAYMSVPKLRSRRLSGRINRMFLGGDYRLNEGYFCDAALDRAEYTGRFLAYRCLSQHIDAKKVMRLVAGYDGRFKYSGYLWGDINLKASFVGRSADRNIHNVDLMVDDIRSIFNLHGSRNRVKALVRGHQHSFQELESGGQVMVTTLPIAEDSAEDSEDEEFFPEDLAIIFDVAERVGDWSKRLVRRNIDLGITFIEDPVEMYNYISR